MIRTYPNWQAVQIRDLAGFSVFQGMQIFDALGSRSPNSSSAPSNTRAKCPAYDAAGRVDQVYTAIEMGGGQPRFSAAACDR